ncbi:MAG TPA: PspC domain-containing protein [bacterium]|nr:PspC domain-containing protein [bacterium]
MENQSEQNQSNFPNQSPEPKKLFRSSKNKIIFGVCAGLAEYFEIDVLVVRALFILFALMGGGAIVLYIILVFIIPSNNPTENTKQEIQDFAHNLQNKTQEIIGEFKTTRYNEETHDGRKILGLVVLIAGAFLLLKQILPWPIYYYLPWFRAEIFWPLLIMLIGLYLILKSNKK